MSAYPLEMVPDLDLGDDHYLMWTRWEPDDLPGNRQWLGIPTGPLPVVKRWGATIRHYRPDGVLCEGAIQFDGEWQRRVHQIAVERARARGEKEPEYVAWTVERWEPLTCSPSFACHCGDHGYIKNGAWARA